MTIQANELGVLEGKFTIPENVRAGIKRVEFLGRGGSHGIGTFRGQGTLINQTLQSTITEWWGVARVDPLAQTFSLDADTTISGVDLWFSVKGTSRVLVQIRDTTAGVPNQTILTQGELTPDTISLNPLFTRFTWRPVRLEAGHEYALVVMCDNALAEVRIAELGKWDSRNQRWVTSQPYQVGVLLSSSNASTWTAHQDRDLTFRLLSSLNTQTQWDLELSPVTVSGIHEAIVLAQVERPTADCDVRFELTLPDANHTVITVVENQPVLFPAAITGTITWKAIFNGTVTASPRMAPDVQFIGGARPTSANYISRALPASANCKVNVYYDVITPGASTVIAEAQNGASWASIPLDSSTPIGDGWVSVKRQLLAFSPTNNLSRVRLTLNGSSAQRPVVRNLQVIITP